MRLLPIESLDDPQVADYRNLRDADLRREHGLFIAEGRLGVRQLIEESRFRTRSVLLTPTVLSSMRPVVERLDERTPVFVTSRGTLNEVVGYPMHRGCLAAGERGEPVRAEDLFAPEGQPSLLLVLEQIANPDNVGGIFRNAWAFGADAVLLSPQCSDPLYRKAIRVSMGATVRLPFGFFVGWPESLRALRAAGYRLLALQPREGSVALGDFGTSLEIPRRVALLLGGEEAGLSRATLEWADWGVRIPMQSGVDSLNVATASGIAMHHVSFRRGPSPFRSGRTAGVQP